LTSQHREPSGSLVPYGALGFAYFASIGLFNPYTPLWFQSLGYSSLAIGVIASLQSWTRIVVPYGWSWLGDHWGAGARRVDLLRIATALILLASLGLLLVTDVVAVAIVVVLIFMANGAVMPLTEAVVAQRLATEQGVDLARYGRVRMWGSIGFILAVTLFGLVLERGGIATLPGWLVLVFGLLALAGGRLPGQSPPATAALPPMAGVNVWRVLRQPEVAWLFGGIFFTVLAHTSLYVFFSIYLDGLGYGKGAVGALWAMAVAAEIAFFWSQGHWFARWDAHTWLLAAALACVLRFAAMAALGGAWWLLVLTQCLHAITFAAQHAACISLIDRHFAGPARGRGQALYSILGYGLSGVIGGVGFGAISLRWGLPAVFGCAAAVSVAATLCCWRSRRLALSAAGGAQNSRVTTGLDQN
jgi:MFS transporter, PPP family, 3-phenylpropionic acid transporter